MHPCPRYLQAQDFQILMDIFIFEKKRIVSYLFVLLENSTSYRIFKFLAQKWSTFSTFGQRKNHNFLDSRYFFGSNLETPMLLLLICFAEMIFWAFFLQSLY